MNFIKQLLAIFQENSDPLNFAGLLLSAVVAIYVFKNQNAVSLVKERHDKMIFPLFDLLEPTLYQELHQQTLENALSIINKHRNLADGKLLEIAFFCSQTPSQENYNLLCSYIDKAYDNSCRRLGLKTRSLTYRCLRKQYKSFFHLMRLLISYALFSMVIGYIAFLLFLSCIFYLYTLFESANNMIQMPIILLFLLVLAKIPDKHY